jgi:hypothetical protein
MAVQVTVAAPARQPRLGGIRPVSTWVENARIGAAESVVYVSNGCTFPLPAIGLCYGTAVVTEKTGVGIDSYTGISAPFALYGGVECFIGPDNDFEERARAILAQGEDRAVEGVLQTWLNTNAVAAGNGPLFADRIAVVEQHADANYLGRPIIVMSRAGAVRAFAEGAIEYGIDGIPTTVNGTPVLATSKLTTNNVFAVGAITVLRSETTVINTVDVTTNTDWAVAEAVYSIIIDCNYASLAISA